MTLGQRRKIVAERYQTGDTQMGIAESLGVNQATISRDLKAISDDWRASAIRDFDVAKGFAIARLEHIIREAWSAFERSKENVVATKYHTDRRGNQQRTTITKTQYGDARFLNIVLKCLAEESKLQDLYP